MSARILILVIFLTTNLFAADFYTKLGVNWSNLQKEDDDSVPGLCAGFGIEHHWKISKGISSTIELLYIRKKSLLEERTWPAGFDPEYSSIRIGDLPIDISYLELPVKIGSDLKSKNGNYSIRLFIGGSVSIPIAYHSKSRSRTLFLTPDERDGFEFDYLRSYQSTQATAFNYLGGIAFAFKQLGFEIVYVGGISELKSLRGLTISDRLNSIQTVFLYYF